MNIFLSVPIGLQIEHFDWMEVVVKPENKRVVLATLEYLISTENIAFRSDRSSLTVLEEKLGVIPITFLMTKFHPMFKEFSEQILRHRELGGYRGVKIKTRKEQTPPLVLTMDDLQIGFILCLFPLTLSVVTFLIEMTFPKTQEIILDFKLMLSAYCI